jgi:hypothetical protein
MLKFRIAEAAQTKHAIIYSTKNRYIALRSYHGHSPNVKLEQSLSRGLQGRTKERKYSTLNRLFVHRHI